MPRGAREPAAHVRRSPGHTSIRLVIARGRPRRGVRDQSRGRSSVRQDPTVPWIGAATVRSCRFRRPPSPIELQSRRGTLRPRATTHAPRRGPRRSARCMRHRDSQIAKRARDTLRCDSSSIARRGSSYSRRVELAPSRVRCARRARSTTQRRARSTSTWRRGIAAYWRGIAATAVARTSLDPFGDAWHRTECVPARGPATVVQRPTPARAVARGASSPRQPSSPWVLQSCTPRARQPTSRGRNAASSSKSRGRTRRTSFRRRPKAWSGDESPDSHPSHFRVFAGDDSLGVPVRDSFGPPVHRDMRGCEWRDLSSRKVTPE